MRKIVREECEKTMPGVKRKEKSRWMTKETWKSIKDRQKAKVEGDKSGLESLIQFFNNYHVEIKRMMNITIVNVRGDRENNSKRKNKVSLPDDSRNKREVQT